MGVLLFWEDLAEDQGVVDIFTSVRRDVIVVDNEEGIFPLNALSCSLRVPSYPLVEAAHIIGVGCGPGGVVLGVFKELAILHELAFPFIEYYQSHDTGSGCVFPGAVSNGQIRSVWVWLRRGEDGT